MRISLLTVLAFGLFLAGVPAAEKPKEKPKTDRDKLQGTWQTIKAELGGTPLPDDIIKDLKYVIKDDKIVTKGVPQVVMQYAECSFKLDPSTKPKSIDFKILAGDRKDDNVEGIYEFNGDDELKFCAQLIGKDRPGEFATKEGQQRVYIVLKREK